MSTIRKIVFEPPVEPATDQHPDAAWYGPIEHDGKQLWAATLNGAPTAQEIDAVLHPPGPTLDQIYDDVIQNQKVLKALVLSLNDGTLPVGTNKTNAQLKTIIKARM